MDPDSYNFTNYQAEPMVVDQEFPQDDFLAELWHAFEMEPSHLPSHEIQPHTAVTVHDPQEDALRLLQEITSNPTVDPSVVSGCAAPAPSAHSCASAPPATSAATTSPLGSSPSAYVPSQSTLSPRVKRMRTRRRAKARARRQADHHEQLRRIRQYGIILKEPCKRCAESGRACKQFGSKTRCEHCVSRNRGCTLCDSNDAIFIAEDLESGEEDDNGPAFLHYAHGAASSGSSTTTRASVSRYAVSSSSAQSNHNVRLQLAALQQRLEEFSIQCDIHAAAEANHRAAEAQTRRSIASDLTAILRHL
ncbi:hypothetical protein A1Q2_01397 [Trichosporon asahii var. asahii CBS 8904]|uniref:Uncharacterized protein n=1 Tax=Trichosporon asahii var. asahii (strain CBS 8904) TaxID=1220162 RepID=K1VV14_TRIAC|nr:hypothetical protein A1Q2_01397 [Trichosporon asahii var. asahii CBS 8904]